MAYFETDHDGWPQLSVIVYAGGKNYNRAHKDKALWGQIDSLARELDAVVTRHAKENGWFETIDGRDYWPYTP